MMYSVDKVGRGMMEQKDSLVMFRDDNTHTNTHTLRERKETIRKMGKDKRSQHTEGETETVTVSEEMLKLTSNQRNPKGTK